MSGRVNRHPVVERLDGFDGLEALIALNAKLQRGEQRGHHRKRPVLADELESGPRIARRDGRPSSPAVRGHKDLASSEPQVDIAPGFRTATTRQGASTRHGRDERIVGIEHRKAILRERPDQAALLDRVSAKLPANDFRWSPLTAVTTPTCGRSTGRICAIAPGSWPLTSWTMNRSRHGRARSTAAHHLVREVIAPDVNRSAHAT